MLLVHLQPVVIVRSLFAMPLQPMEEWVVFLILGSVSIGALP